MVSAIDRLMQDGCSTDDKTKVCRSRGGESCAFDGAMIVLQPIADTAHIVHGPIACCGNTWEGRGTLSSKGELHTMGFTTDMSEIDIVYGAGKKLHDAIVRTHQAVQPKAIFVHATCVSGLIGEDIEAVCKDAEADLGIRVIAVSAPGFTGPKNLGNRIAGEVLLDLGHRGKDSPYWGGLARGANLLADFGALLAGWSEHVDSMPLPELFDRILGDKAAVEHALHPIVGCSIRNVAKFSRRRMSSIKRDTSSSESAANGRMSASIKRATLV